MLIAKGAWGVANDRMSDLCAGGVTSCVGLLGEGSAWTYSDVAKTQQPDAAIMSPNGAVASVGLGGAAASVRVASVWNAGARSSVRILREARTALDVFRAWRTGLAPKKVDGVCASCSARGVKSCTSEGLGRSCMLILGVW